MDPRDALDQTIKAFQLTAANLAAESGTAPEDISRYRRKRKDMNSLGLMLLVKALPPDARRHFWWLLMSAEPAQPLERMTTEAGRRNLGLLLKSARLSLGWSIRDLSRELEERTGLSLSPPTIGDLEKGTWEPQWNTLVKLVALGYIRHPQAARGMTVYELFQVACEVFESSAQQSFESCASDESVLTLSNAYTFVGLETQSAV